MKQVEAVIFDWAGTMADFGSLAPLRAVTEVFAREGVRVNTADARRDMGIFKKDHIRRILHMPHICAAWTARHGRHPSESDVDRLFAQFISLQVEAIEAHSQLIAGAGEVVEALRGRGLKIGSTTGYTRPMLDTLLASAAKQGYRPDAALCPDDVGGGRPLPWMCLRIALEFQLSSTACAVKAGDTVSDIEEALNAGMWAVGVAATGNEVGMSAEEFEALDESERHGCLARARETLSAAGAHHVIDSVAGIESVLDAINRCLAAGERP